MYIFINIFYVGNIFNVWFSKLRGMRYLLNKYLVTTIPAPPRKNCSVNGWFCTVILASQIVLNFAFAPSWVQMGHFLKLKHAHSNVPSAHYFSFNKCLFWHKAVQMPNLALIETKRTTECLSLFVPIHCVTITQCFLLCFDKKTFSVIRIGSALYPLVRPIVTSLSYNFLSSFCGQGKRGRPNSIKRQKACSCRTSTVWGWDEPSFGWDVA